MTTNQQTTAQNDPNSQAANQARREAAQRDRQEREDQVAKDRAEMEKRNLERMAADAKLKPTPTPEEIELAKQGHIVDHKEPDGSPQQNPNHPVVGIAKQLEVGNKMPETKPAPGNDGAPLTPKQQAEANRNADKAATEKK